MFLFAVILSLSYTAFLLVKFLLSKEGNTLFIGIVKQLNSSHSRQKEKKGC